jgi:hypothetical protein
MIYSLVVEGLIFAQTDVFGDYLPPQSSIIAVLSKIGKGKVSLSDAEIAKAMMLFCELSNTYTQQLYAVFCPDEYLSDYVGDGGTDPEILEYIRLNRKWLNLLKSQAELLQRDFRIPVQCLAVIGWYSSIIGDMGVINEPLIAEKNNKMLNVFHKKKPREKYRESWNFKEYNHHLFDYPDFVWALESYSDFSSFLLENTGYKLKDSDTKEIRKGVTFLRKWQMEMSAIDIARIKLCKPSQPDLLTGFCTNCMTNYQYDRQVYKQDKKTSSLCPRIECISEYNTNKTLKSRHKKKVEKKWVGSKRGVCKCGNIEEVNDKNLCCKCYKLK